MHRSFAALGVWSAFAVSLLTALVLIWGLVRLDTVHAASTTELALVLSLLVSPVLAVASLRSPLRIGGRVES